MKKVLVCLFVFSLAFLLVSCNQTHTTEPTDEIEDSYGLGGNLKIDYTNYHYVEPLEEPAHGWTGCMFTGAECFQIATHFVRGTVVSLQELEVEYSYEGHPDEKSTEYCTIITFKVAKNYGDKQLDEMNTDGIIKVMDARSSHNMYGSVALHEGGEYAFPIREYTSKLLNFTDHASYSVVCTSFMIIEKSGDMYNAGVFMDFLLRNKVPEENYDSDKPTTTPEIKLYTLKKIEKAIKPYLSTMKGLEEWEVYNEKKEKNS